MTLRAARLAARLVLAPDERPGEPWVLDVDGELVEALIYRPRRPARGTVLAVHGLTLRAHRDPRLVALCRAVAADGFRVVCPRVSGLDTLDLVPETATRIARLAERVRSDPQLGAPKIGLFAASFAAGLSLVAAATPSLAGHLSAILLVGGYVDPFVLLSHVLSSSDPYGRLIVLRSFADLPARLRETVDTALADESLRREPELARALAAMSAEDRERYAELVRPGSDRVAEVLAACASRVESLAVAPSIRGVRAPVTLIHGRCDPVVPSSESVDLARRLEREGVPVRLHLTDLVGHGDLAWSPAHLAEVPRLLGTLGGWLSSLAPSGVARSPSHRAPTSTGS